MNSLTVTMVHSRAMAMMIILQVAITEGIMTKIKGMEKIQAVMEETNIQKAIEGLMDMETKETMATTMMLTAVRTIHKTTVEASTTQAKTNKTGTLIQEADTIKTNGAILHPAEVLNRHMVRIIRAEARQATMVDNLLTQVVIPPVQADQDMVVARRETTTTTII
jgi:hypothetical protein